MFKKKKKSLSEYSSWELIGYRFKKNKLAMIGVIMFAAIVIVTIFGPVFIPYERVIEQNVREKLQSPNAKYIFGTDELGRDLFARIIYGGRISLLCGLAIIGIAFVIGAIIGGIAGFVGGKVDTFLMRIVDALMAVPPALLAMAIITALGNGVWKLIIALSIAQVSRFARIVRSSVLTLRNMEYVEAAKCYGSSSMRILI